MAEGAAVGILPHDLLDKYDHRMLFAAFRGATIRDTRERKLSLWASWNTANFTRAKKLPNLGDLLRKLDPSPVMMTAKAIRATVFGLASAMGAKVTRTKRKD